MPAWKVLLVGFLAFTTLGLVLTTIIVPLSVSEKDGKWWWFAGLLVASIAMISILVMFLRHADRTFKR